jgi:very-short-patch-repair endonuclease
MDVAKIAEYAQSLYNAHGDKAEAEAAQKAKKYREEGNEAEAQTWQSVRRAISEIRGAHES